MRETNQRMAGNTAVVPCHLKTLYERVTGTGFNVVIKFGASF